MILVVFDFCLKLELLLERSSVQNLVACKSLHPVLLKNPVYSQNLSVLGLLYKHGGR